MRPPTPYWSVVAVHMTRFGSVTPRSGSGCQSGSRSGPALTWRTYRTFDLWSGEILGAMTEAPDYLAGRSTYESGRLVDIGEVKLWFHDSGGDGEPLFLIRRNDGRPLSVRFRPAVPDALPASDLGVARPRALRLPRPCDAPVRPGRVVGRSARAARHARDRAHAPLGRRLRQLRLPPFRGDAPGACRRSRHLQRRLVGRSADGVRPDLERLQGDRRQLRDDRDRRSDARRDLRRLRPAVVPRLGGAQRRAGVTARDGGGDDRLRLPARRQPSTTSPGFRRRRSSSGATARGTGRGSTRRPTRRCSSCSSASRRSDVATVEDAHPAYWCAEAGGVRDDRRAFLGRHPLAPAV